ncbi:GNAT family N-acetyltransferase [Streptomyces albiflavescens]|uniref:GNAT family N-acetyltransferase n=1 Tax=Streptomyces albiflavescens TaxID=1623582 RepID=UPI0035711445
MRKAHGADKEADRHGSWGAGLAREAAKALLRAAADELPDQPVLVVTLTANESSPEVATRLGFHRADVGREADSWS